MASSERLMRQITDNRIVINPSVIDPYHPGDRVILATADCAHDKTEGEPVVVSHDRVVISRWIDSDYKIFLHLPREGFDLSLC